MSNKVISSSSASIGLAGAGSLAKSLGTSAKSSAPKLGGQTPKLGIGKGSSFAESLIQRVVEGESPRSVVAGYGEAPDSFERDNATISPKGQRVSAQDISPGMYIGVRGPTHNGVHVVDEISGEMIRLKCSSGHLLTIPLADLDNHEVVHSHEYV